MNAGAWLRARREWRRHWIAVTLLAVLIALGGGATVAAAAAARRTDTAFDRMLQIAHEPNLGVASSISNGGGDLDPALLDRVMQIEGVRGVTQLAGMAVAPEGFPNFYAFAVIDARGQALRSMRLEGDGATSGDVEWIDIKQIENFGADQVWLNEAMRDEVGVGVGATIRLESLASFSEVIDVRSGPTTSLRIIGVGRGPEDVSDAPDPLLVLPPAFYVKYHDAIGSCACNVLVNADPSAVEVVSARLAEIYPNAEIGPTEDLRDRVAPTASLQKRTWWVIGLAAAVAAVSALLLAAARLAQTVSKDEDVYRSLGMTTRELRLGRFMVMAPAALLGTGVAAGFAYAVSSIAPVGLTLRAEPAPGLRWDSSVILPGLVAVLVVALAIAGLASVVERRADQRLTSSIRLGGPAQDLGSRLAFGAGRGAIVGVFLFSAGVVGALTVQHSVDHVLDTPALYGADFDAVDDLYTGKDKREVAEALRADGEIEAVALVWIPQRVDRDPIHVTGPGGSTDVDPKAFESIKGTVSTLLTRGRLPDLPNEVAVGQAVMDQLGVTIGDTVIATGSLGDQLLTIVGDNRDPGVDFAGYGFAVTVDGLSNLDAPVIYSVVARFTTDADQTVAIDRHTGLRPVSPPSAVRNIGQLGGLPIRVGQLLTLLGGVALLSGVVHTLRLSRRELAVHRALGFTERQVVAAHVWQAMLTATVGGLAGGGVGFLAGRAIHRELVGNVGAVAETILPGTLWVVTGTIVAACLCAGFVTGALALRHTPGEVLRVE